MNTELYGYEITPISKTELNLRAVYNVDPKMDLVPAFMINWTNR